MTLGREEIGSVINALGPQGGDHKYFKTTRNYHFGDELYCLLRHHHPRADRLLRKLSPADVENPFF